MSLFNNKITRATRQIVLALLASYVLVSCGGGGGSSPVPKSQVYGGTIQSGVVVVPASESATITLDTVIAQPDTLVINNPTGTLATIQTGQIVSLPANDAQGIPMGLTAKVTKNADGSVTLAPAAMEDVFSKLKIDFDSTRDGAIIAGLISPKNGTMTLSQTPPVSQQTGLEYASCMLGLTLTSTVACKNGELAGKIEIAQQILVNQKGSTNKANAIFYATIDVSKVGAKVIVDYDASKGGLNRAMVKLTGQWGASTGVKLVDVATQAVDYTTQVEIPSLSELIRGNSANIWDTNTKLKFGKYFEISGLNGDDKKGLIPLGGFYLTPACTTPLCTTPFNGDLSATQLEQIKAGAVVVWVYLDFAGNITLSGDLSFFKFNGAYIEKGFDITEVNGVLSTQEINPPVTTTSIYAPYLKGSFDVKQNAGLAVAADLLVGGIRPFTLKAEVVGADITGTAEGEGGYRWSPDPQGLEGNICFSAARNVYSDLVIKGRIKAKLAAGWLSVSGGAEQTWGPWTKTWWSKSAAECVNTYTLPLSFRTVGIDAADATKTKIEGDFFSTYSNTAIRDQVGIWRLYEDGPLQSTWTDVDTTYGGLFTLSRLPGIYTFTLVALHKTYIGSDGNPIEVVRSAPVSVTVSSAPLVDFSAALNNNDCKALVLTSAASAAGGATISNYEWAVTPSGGVPTSQAGVSKTAATFTLASCGIVGASLKVTDSNGLSTIKTQSIDTVALVIPPTCPTGQVLQNGQCITPPPPSSFVDNFDGTALQGAYWSPIAVAGASGVTVNVSGGIADFSCSSTGPHSGVVDTNGKYTFSGDPITIEARMAGSGTSRNTSIYIVEANNAGEIAVGDTNYGVGSGLGGLYTGGSGVFNLPQTGNDISVNGYKEYRVTLSGTSLKVERGDTLANITETRTVTLGSSIAGKTFYLRIGSASQPYCPAAYDWVRVMPNAGTPAPVIASTLNDTGITAMQCYQAGSDVLVDCASAGALALNNAQDGMVGRDANPATNSNADGKLGFSFTAVADGANPNGCVQDNVTGLMWENKTNDGGLRDWNKTYTNYSATYDPNLQYGTATDASGFVTAVNATNLCGYSDWRLPTADELQGIVDYSVVAPGPAIDSARFPNTQSNAFWSGSPVGVNSVSNWIVAFFHGDLRNENRSISYYVRLVRANPSGSPSARYTQSVNGQEVIDNTTKLIWRRCAEGMSWDGTTCTGIASTFTHEAALQLAAAQASSTGVAWHLPNVKELSSIADKSLSNPAIDPVAFPATPNDLFWSASPSVNNPTTAWDVYFVNGDVGYNGVRNNAHYVRLVHTAP